MFSLLLGGLVLGQRAVRCAEHQAKRQGLLGFAELFGAVDVEKRDCFDELARTLAHAVLNGAGT